MPSTGSLLCQAGALTPSTFTCLPRPCFAPTGITHALASSCASGSTIQHAASCVTQCQDGYVQVPSTLSCSLGVLSNGGTFQCQPAPCDAPTGVAHTLVPSCQSPVVADSSVCLPQCEQGYMPIPSSVGCNLGNLSDIFDCVEKPCSQPDGVLHSSVRCSNCNGSQPCMTHGGVCITQCDEGFLPSVSSLQCSFGNLTPSTFSCEPSPCSLSLSVAHAAAIPCSQGNLISHAGACTTQCMNGYEPNPSTLHCFRGTLTPSSFTCSPLSCSFPLTVAHVSVPSCSGGNSVVPHGDNCSVQCQGLWKPVPTSLSCSLGVFSPSNVSCEGDPCPVPDGIENALNQPCADIGDDNITNIKHGDSCRGQCETGYEASPASLSCNFGTLQPSTFNCSEKGCSAPTGVQNAKSVACYQGTSFLHGQTCTVQCVTGYVPSVVNLTCSKGTLHPSTFTCIAVNTHISSSVELTVSDPSVFTTTDTAQSVKVRQALWQGIANALTDVKIEWVFILRVYTATNSSQGTNSRRLSGNVMVDFKIEIPHASIASGGVTSASIQQSVRASITEPKMRRSINTQLTERNLPSEVWSTELKSVQSVEVDTTSCIAPLNIAHATAQRCAQGATISDGAWCRASCESGYYAQPEWLGCTNGHLLPTEFTCKRSTCSAPTGVLCQEGTVISHRSACTVVCPSDYSPSNKSLSCSLGTLSPASSECINNAANVTKSPSPDYHNLQSTQDSTAVVTLAAVVIAGAVLGLIGYATLMTARHGRQVEELESADKMTEEDMQPNGKGADNMTEEDMQPIRKGPAVADEAWRPPLPPTDSERRAPHPQHLDEDMKAPSPPTWPAMRTHDTCSRCGNICMDDAIYCGKCGTPCVRAGMDPMEGGGGMLPSLPGLVDAVPDHMTYGMPYPGSGHQNMRPDYFADSIDAHSATGTRRPPTGSTQGGFSSEAPDDEEDDPDLFLAFFEHLND